MTRAGRPTALRASLCALAAMTLVPGAGSGTVRLGNEFQVNTYTTGAQSVSGGGGRRRRRLRRRLGKRSQDGSVYGVFARRFSSAGAPSPPSSRSTPTPRLPEPPVGGDGRRRRLRRRLEERRPGRLGRTASSPAASRAPALPSPASSRSTPTPRASRTLPAVAAEADGDFVVVWQSDGQDGSIYGVFARRFSSAGAPSPSSSRSTPTPRATRTVPRWRRQPTATSSSPGTAPRTVPRHLRPPLLERGRRARRRVPGQRLHHRRSEAPRGGGRTAPATSSWPGRATSRTATRRHLRSPLLERGRRPRRRVPGQPPHRWTGRSTASVAIDGDGDFVVAWESTVRTATRHGVFARRFSSAGAPVAAEFQVNTYTTDYQSLALGGGGRRPATSSSPGGASPTRTARTTASSRSASPASRSTSTATDRPSRSPTACWCCAICSASAAPR